MDKHSGHCFSPDTVNTQQQSALFSLLPAEIRFQILELCVTECEDRVKRYPRNALWNRPGHHGPRTTYTEILQTCKRAYQEGWFLPIKHTSITLYLTAMDRRPANSINPFVLEEQLKSLDEPLELKNLEIFAQLCWLEPGMFLQQIYEIKNLMPKTVTITLRHTDFWYWENDEPLKVEAGWLDVPLPASVEHVVLNFETLERRAREAEFLAKAVSDSWRFERQDGVKLVSNWAEAESSSWKGSSTLNKQRWLRDETEPGLICYVFATVHFRPSDRLREAREDAEEEECPDVDATPAAVSHAPPDIEDFVAIGGTTVAMWSSPSVRLTMLKKAGVPPGTPAMETRRLLTTFKCRQAEDLRIHRLERYHDKALNGDDWYRADSEGDQDAPSSPAASDDQVAAEREEDELERDDVIAEDRSMDLFFLPGYPRTDGRTLRDGRFGGVQTGYEYLFWQRKFVEWRRIAKDMALKYAGRLRTQMMPFFVPKYFEDPNADLSQTEQELRAAVERDLGL